MAERRMFAKTIIDSDAFLDMPVTSQLLYFHLAMRADDDGFVNRPKSIMRMVGCKDDDANILIAKKFILPFESGVIVIKHWKIHNYIRNDRYVETKYKEEKSTLELDENGAYTSCQQVASKLPASCQQVANQVDTIGIPLVSKMDTQVRLEVRDRDRVNVISAEVQAPHAPAAIDLPLVNGTWHEIHDEEIAEWTAAYPAVDVLQELREMRSWLKANPKRQKTARGINTFIVTWLSREQDKGGRFRNAPKADSWTDKQKANGRIVDRSEPSDTNILQRRPIKLKREE